MTEMLDRIARAINPGLWDQALRGPYTVHVIPDNGASFTRGMSVVTGYLREEGSAGVRVCENKDCRGKQQFFPGHLVEKIEREE